MKKQILILTFFTLALIFAGMNSYGQTAATYDDALTTVPGSCLTPTTLTCFGIATSLHPSPGIDYTYTITSEDTDATNNTETVHWFVIENGDLGIINPSVDIATLTGIDPANGSMYLLGADGAYNTPAQTSDAITLSWNYFNGQSEVVLLVAYVEDAVNCTDNIEVYRIFPEFSFTLDIAAIDQSSATNEPLAIGTNGAECVSPVESAIYAPGATSPANNGEGTLTVDYGSNYVYFMVNAANFVGAWQPEFTFAYDGAGTIADAAWTYPNASNDNTATWHTITVATGVSADPVIGGGGAALANGTALYTAADLTPVGATGECIVVRVHLDHGTLAENVVQRSLTVTVDGTMYDAAAAAGSEYATAALEDFGPDVDADPECDQVKLDDVSTYDITPRPNVNEVDPIPFELKTGRDL